MDETRLCTPSQFLAKCTAWEAAGDGSACWFLPTMRETQTAFLALDPALGIGDVQEVNQQVADLSLCIPNKIKTLKKKIDIKEPQTY